MSWVMCRACQSMKHTKRFTMHAYFHFPPNSTLFNEKILENYDALDSKFIRVFSQLLKMIISIKRNNP